VIQHETETPEAIEPIGQQPQPPSPPPPASGPVPSRGWVVRLVVVIALATGGYFVWRAFFAAPKFPESIVALSGRIEGDDSAIAPKTTGRILEIRFREGDSVKAGETIAVLSDDQILAGEAQAHAAEKLRHLAPARRLE
jgi:HlyD family secretion protein